MALILVSLFSFSSQAVPTFLDEDIVFHSHRILGGLLHAQRRRRAANMGRPGQGRRCCISLRWLAPS